MYELGERGREGGGVSSWDENFLYAHAHFPRVTSFS